MAEQSAQTHIWECTELSLQAQQAYANPFRDVELTAEFLSSTGERIVVPGFWDGGNVWKIRFAPTTPGTWTWRTVSSTLMDSGLHGVQGTIVAAPWSASDLEENPNRRGFVRVHSSGRYFEYADGTPFYWLGDTLWSGHWSGCDVHTDFPLYLQDRKTKGFTVIQFGAARPVGTVGEKPLGSYWETIASGGTSDFINEGGAAYTSFYDRINPAYFQHLDIKIRMMLDQGFVPCLLGAWGWDLAKTGAEHMAEFWRYLVARYAAYQVMWCLAGEYFFTADVEGWRRVGQAVHRYDPYAHPTSAHSIAPHSGSRHYQADDWYDFNLIQVGHAYSLRQFMKTLPYIDYHLQPTKPSIMSESWYENHATTLGEGERRFDDRDIRFVTYVPLLQGCIGQAYGAHGIWPWASEQDAKGTRFNTPSSWKHDLVLPGSAQMRHLRDLMSEVHWWRLAPHPELVSAPGPTDVYCAAEPGREYLVYVEGEQERVVLFLQPDKDAIEEGTYEGRWFNPRTGEWQAAEGQRNWFGNFVRWSASVPTREDWVLLLRRVRD